MERPGKLISDRLAELQWSQQDLADVMGRPVQAINQIIAGSKSITVQTARELEAAFTSPSAMEWLRLEIEYRFSHDDSGGVEAKAIKQRLKLHEVAPVRDMMRRGWIARSNDSKVIESEVCRFFGQNSLSKIKYPSFSARSSLELTAAHGTWAQRAHTLAETLKPKRYSRKRLEASIGCIRELLSVPSSVSKIPEILSKCGVRLLFIEHLPRTRIDGAAFWIPPGTQKSPVIAMSLRFGRIDYFSFTLLHEIAHILNGDDPSFDTEMNSTHTDLTDREVIANKWASETLLAPSELKKFLVSTNSAPSKALILRFASIRNVHPGVVVGQLQHRGIVAFSSHRDLLVDVRGDLLAQRQRLEHLGLAKFDGFGLKAGEVVD